MTQKTPIPKQKYYTNHLPVIRDLIQKCRDHVSLQYFKPSVPIEAYTDFSRTGFGYVILQNGQPVFQGSKTVTSADETLSVWEGELLCITLVIDRLEGYRTPGQVLVWRTDSKTLLHWKTIMISDTRRPRVRYALQQIAEAQVQVEFIPGESNPADYLSRHPEEDAPPMPTVNFERQLSL
eukprot:GHVO01007816.1.p1 GENE.GHVO01007816.1~~GHVO01007816.1.p1  ORF type:complete len:180 (+),score=7.39 GHVO01007816.1:216-755(+)